MIRTLHVIDSELPTNLAQQVLRLKLALQNLGCESSVCSFSTNELDRITSRALFGEDAITFCALSSRFDLTFVPRFARTLRDANPNVIHYFGRPNLTLWLASRAYGTNPLIANLTREGLSNGSFHFALRQAKWLLPSLRLVSDHATNWSDVVIQPGVTNASLRTTGVSSSLREHLQLDAKAKLIAVRSDLRTTNRGKDLIWAVDCLRVLHPDCYLIFFGRGKDEGELRDYAMRANTDSNVVRFVRPDQEVDGWFEQCDCFWSAETHCNLNSVLDAMRCGVPVVAADVPESRSAIKEGKTGFLVPVGDSAEFARRTNVLFQDPTLASTVRDAAATDVEAFFSVDQMARRYFALYQEQLAVAKGPATMKVA